MSFTNIVFLIILVIFVLGIILLIEGIKKNSKKYIWISILLFIIIVTIIYLLGRFVIRM